MRLTPPSLHLRLRNEPSATRTLRQAVERVADACGLSAADRFDLKVAATEALTNALKGAPGDHEIDVTISARAGAVDVEVRDREAFVPRASADAESGRGIPLMLALADEVEFAASADGTRVRMRKRSPPAL